MLCARVVRSAASSAKAVSEARAMRALFSASKGLSMPISAAPGFISASSASSGARTLSTSFAPRAWAAVPMVAPTAS